jgi:hypothetical protein
MGTMKRYSASGVSATGGTMTLEPKRNGAIVYGPATASVDLTLPSSVMFWTRFWNVTLIQLRIAVSRAGPLPSDIARELGLGPDAVKVLPMGVADNLASTDDHF